MDIPEDIEIIELLDKGLDNITILGLDQALLVSGFGVIKNGEVIDSGTHRNTSKTTSFRMCSRRSLVLDALKELVKKHNPDLVVIEDNHFARNIQTLDSLAGLRAVLENYLFKSDIPFIVMKPVEWRSRLKIQATGKDKKKASIDKVKEIVGEQLPEDESEGILIAFGGLEVLKRIDKFGLDKIRKEMEKKPRRRKRKRK